MRDDEPWSSVRLYLYSSDLLADQMRALTALAPDEVSNKGEPVSSRRPEGPKRSHSTVMFRARPAGGSTNEQLANLARLVPLLEIDATSWPQGVRIELSLHGDDAAFVSDLRVPIVLVTFLNRLGGSIVFFIDEADPTHGHAPG